MLGQRKFEIFYRDNYRPSEIENIVKLKGDQVNWPWMGKCGIGTVPVLEEYALAANPSIWLADMTNTRLNSNKRALLKVNVVYAFHLSKCHWPQRSNVKHV